MYSYLLHPQGLPVITAHRLAAGLDATAQIFEKNK